MTIKSPLDYAESASGGRHARQAENHSIVLSVLMSSIPAEIQLRVSPSASRSELVYLSDGVFHIKIAAPPVKGKANAELLSFLSKQLGISRTALTILKGHTSRSKIIGITGLNQREIEQRLTSLLSASGASSKRTRESRPTPD
ncbi:DUF167 domain-containing protein [Chloroflexota bacterium]